MTIIFGLTIIFIYPAVSYGGENQWTGNGPDGGTVQALAISPNFATDHTLFAGTTGGVFKSTDAGVSWSDINNGLTGTNVSSFGLSPNFAVDHTIYVGIDSGYADTNGGVFKSADAGASWSPINSGLNSTRVSSLGLSPNFAMDHTLFVATGEGGGVFKSTDAGGSWSQVNNGLDDVSPIASLAISPNFATDNTVFVGTGASANIFKSTDAGGSWSRVYSTYYASTDVISLHISASFATDHTIFAVIFGYGIVESTDAGASWSVLTSSGVYSLSLSPNFAIDHTLFAGTNGGVFKSTDQGASWTPVNDGLNATDVYSLGLSPNFGTDFTLYAGPRGGGVFKSTDAGVSWSPVNIGLSGTDVSSVGLSPNFATDHTLFAGTTGGVFKSTDAGASWSTVNTGLTSTGVSSLGLSSSFATDHTLFAGTNVGVFKSTDAGASWVAVNNGLTNSSITSLGLSPSFATDHTLFAGKSDGVFKSTDAGVSWVAVNNGLTNIIISLGLSPSFATDHTLFAGTLTHGVYESTDGGASWSEANSGLTNSSITSLGLSPNFATDHTLFAGTWEDGAVFKSTDAGDSWNGVNNGLTEKGVYALGLSPSFATDHTLFAGTADDGVFKSTDAGASWSPVNNGLIGTQVSSLGVSPSFATDKTMFAGTQGGGVFSFSFSSDTTPPTVTNVLPEGTIYTASTTISVDYSDAGSGINIASVVVKLDGNVLSGCSATAADVNCPVNAMSNGSHTISGSVTDNGGNTAQVSGSFSVEVYQLNYYWTWYDNVGGDNWLLMANADSNPGHYTLNVAGADQYLPNGGDLAPGASMTPQFAGLIGGPVKAVSTAGTSGILSQRTLWPKGGNSLEEVLATEESKLSDHFWWTWYDETSGFQDWVLVGNPSDSATVHYVIKVAGVNRAEGDLTPGQEVTPHFPGIIGGPVELTTTGGNVMASQRVLSDGGKAFNEVPGIPAGELSSDYLWTWYDQNEGPGVTNWILIANPGPSEIHYGGEIGSLSFMSLDTIAPGATKALTFPGDIGGPVRVRTWSDGGAPAPSICSQRVLWGPSFEEVPGMPATALNSVYNWTWYDQNEGPGVTNWVLVANPRDASGPIYYELEIGNQTFNGGPIAPGENATPTFPGTIGGPVQVRTFSDANHAAPANSISSQRVLWNGYFNEVMGTVLN